MPTLLLDSRTTAPLPDMVRGLPLLGSTVPLLRDPLVHLRTCFLEYGPIFRVNTVTGPWTVLAGQKANRFASQEGQRYFSAGPFYAGMGEALGSPLFLLSLDGADHAHMRKTMSPGFNKIALSARMGELCASTAEAVSSWQPGQLVPFMDATKEIITRQLCVVLTGQDPGDIVHDLRLFLKTINRVTQLKLWPAFMMHLPSYKAAKRKLFALADRVVDAHHPRGTAIDLVDHMLRGTEPQGGPMPRSDVRGATLMAFMAGLDTVAASAAFAVYALLTHPEWHERVTEEVDAVYESNGRLDEAGLKQLKLLRACLMESMRLHPFSGGIARSATEDFVFEGRRVKAGGSVILAHNLSHFDGALFPDPMRFDPERFLPPRNEHKQSFAFAPYGTGPHVCIGAGLGELQLLVFLANLLRLVRLELADPNYVLRVRTEPSRVPVNFVLRVRAR